MDIQGIKEYKKVGSSLLLPPGFLFCAHHRLLRASNVAPDTWVDNMSSPASSAPTALLLGVCHLLLKLLDDGVSLKSLVRSRLLSLTTLLRNQSDLSLVSFYLVPVYAACLSHVKLLITTVWLFDKDIFSNPLLNRSL